MNFAECKEILNSDGIELSDEDISNLIDWLMAFGHMSFDQYIMNIDDIRLFANFEHVLEYQNEQLSNINNEIWELKKDYKNTPKLKDFDMFKKFILKLMASLWELADNQKNKWFNCKDKFFNSLS